MQVEDAVGDLVGSAHEHHPTRPVAGGPVRRRRPGAADLGHARLEHVGLVLQVGGVGLAVVVGDKAVDGDGDGGRLGGVADLGPGLVVGVAVVGPVLRGPAQDPQEHRQPELHGPQDRVGAAAGAEPHPQRLLGSGHDQGVDQWSTPVRPAPGDPVVAVEGQQQLELGAVQQVVVALVQIEDREGDRRGAAAGDGLDATGGDRRRRGQLLEHPDRLVGGQHGDGRAEPDALGGRRSRVDQRVGDDTGIDGV